MEYVLKTKELTKRFGGKLAVSNVDMHIREGEVYGLIGENGAGKTTIMRMVAGLASQTNGEIELFDSSDLNAGRKRIGCVIENPAIYGNMTARENIEVFRRLVGDNRENIAEEILETVGLGDTGKKKAKNFSLGMKQRLSIGIALLGDPDFLILDEPINGLDPTGIAEVRDLITKLNEEKKKTILISSHILGELFKVATHFGVIRKGELVEQFSVEKLQQRCKDCLHLVVDDVEKTKAILLNEYGMSSYKSIEGNEIKVECNADNIARINTTLCMNGVNVSHLSMTGIDFEEYFIDLMKGEKQ